MDYVKLREASESLKRAANAALLAQLYPHSRVLPCKHQETAAQAEVACAEKLIAEAKGA